MLKKILILILALVPAATAMAGGDPKGKNNTQRPGFRNVKDRRVRTAHFPSGNSMLSNILSPNSAQLGVALSNMLTPVPNPNGGMILMGNLDELKKKELLKEYRAIADSIAESLGINPPTHLRNQLKKLDEWNQAHYRKLREAISYLDFFTFGYYEDFHAMVMGGKQFQYVSSQALQRQISSASEKPAEQALNSLFIKFQEYMSRLAFQAKSLLEEKFEAIFKKDESWMSFSKEISNLEEKEESNFREKVLPLLAGILENIPEDDPHKKDAKTTRENFFNEMFVGSYEFFQRRTEKLFKSIQNLPEEDKREFLETRKFPKLPQELFEFLFERKENFFSQNKEECEEADEAVDSFSQEGTQKISTFTNALLEHEQVKPLKKRVGKVARAIIEEVSLHQKEIITALKWYNDSDKSYLDRCFYFACFSKVMEKIEEKMEEVDWKVRESLKFNLQEEGEIEAPITAFKERIIKNIRSVQWLGDENQKSSLGQVTLENLEKTFGIPPKKGLFDKTPKGKDVFEEEKIDISPSKGKSQPDRESEMEALSKGFNHLNLGKKSFGKENFYEAG